MGEVWEELIQVDLQGGGTVFRDHGPWKLQVSVQFSGSSSLGAWKSGRHRTRCKLPALEYGTASTRRLPLLATSLFMKFLLIQIVLRSVEMELELTWPWSIAQYFSVSELSLFVFTQQTRRHSETVRKLCVVSG